MMEYTKCKINYFNHCKHTIDYRRNYKNVLFIIYILIPPQFDKSTVGMQIYINTNRYNIELSQHVHNLQFEPSLRFRTNSFSRKVLIAGSFNFRTK